MKTKFDTNSKPENISPLENMSYFMTLVANFTRSFSRRVMLHKLLRKKNKEGSSNTLNFKGFRKRYLFYWG